MMTIAKASAVAGGLMIAMAVGVWAGQRITDGARGATDATIAPAVDAVPAAAVTATRAHRVPGTRATLTTKRPAIRRISVEVTDPEVSTRLTSLLSEGANLNVAADGFADAEQFAAVAHAARNTGVPFMLMKDRVVTDGRSLTAAIRELRPDVNAAVEADRAVAEARSDLANPGL